MICLMEWLILKVQNFGIGQDFISLIEDSLSLCCFVLIYAYDN